MVDYPLPMASVAHPASRHRLSAALATLAIASLARTGMGEPPATSAPAPTPAPAQPSAEPGPMHGRIYRDLDGAPIDLADAIGKPMVIELWATWCGPCRNQRLLMHRLSEEFTDVVFVAASTDEKGPQVVKDFRAGNPSENPAGSRVRDVMATPELRAIIDRVKKENLIPQTIYVSRKGEIMDVSVGGQNEKFMRALLKNMTRTKPPETKSPTAPTTTAPTAPTKPAAPTTKAPETTPTPTPEQRPASPSEPKADPNAPVRSPKAPANAPSD